jgi:hypothetical protein
MVLFSDLPTNLGNRSSRFPHSHRHDYDGIIPKTSRLRDTHSEGKVRLLVLPVVKRLHSGILASRLRFIMGGNRSFSRDFLNGDIWRGRAYIISLIGLRAVLSCSRQQVPFSSRATS